MTTTLSSTFIPELGEETSGKVRGRYIIDDQLVLISSDRISCFNRILPQQIPLKGQVLNEISQWWFEQTKDIVPNHLIECPDPNVTIAKLCKPLPVEVVVRGYLCGSMWRAYASGARNMYGLTLPEGMEENQAFEQPILTPTTKDEVDRPITRDEIISLGLVDEKTWNQVEEIALKLFERGQSVAQSKGLILVDTKYEFGLDTQGDLTLIDEVHTPDSSRFWFQSDVERKQLRFPDKEYVRKWLQEQGFLGDGKVPELPQAITEKASSGYLDVFQTMLGQPLQQRKSAIRSRVVESLVDRKLIKGYFAVIFAGSTSDAPHVERICQGLEKEGVPHQVIYASAHKQTQAVVDLIQKYNSSLEPVVYIAVAGMSNALGGVLAANTHWPVINCPPFKDHADYAVNIHSSIQMPSNVPAMTVTHPGNAALAAARILKMHAR